MLVAEISKIINVKKIILIASAKNKFELPFVFKLSGKLKLNQLLPYSILKSQNFILNWLFGIESNEERQLLKSILNDTNSMFLKWAINEIVNWKNEIYPENCFHIHGNQDRIIPIKNVKADFVVKNGGHFMTVNKAKDIENIILNLIEK